MKKIIFIIGLGWLGDFANAQNNINQYEYWFDNDFANRVTTNVIPTEQFTLNTAVSATGLENGLHSFNIRFRDEDLNFSSVVSQFFQKVNQDIPGANAIAGFEYWFDDDYANKVSQAVTPQSLYQLNTVISASQLAVGLHTFHVRFIDTGGNWSPTVSQFFQKVNQDTPGTNAIAGFEYWFDDDYANKVSQAVTPQALYQLSTAISAIQLSVGLHTFHVRFIDTGGNWSPAVSQFFQKVNQDTPGANAIAGFEYWFDDDYANKVSQAVTPQTLYQLNTAISASQLAVGLHTFHVRFIDTGGNWSPTVSQFFQKVNQNTPGTNAIAGFEYWFDDDYAGKVFQTVTPQALYQLNTDLNADLLENGLHKLHIRFQDLGGSWSSPVSQFFQKIGQGAGIPNVISSYRYWFDGDVNTMVNQTLNAPSNPLFLLTDLNLSQLDTGQHQINLQFRDTPGQWSMVVTDTIIKLGEPRLDNITPNSGGNTGTVTVNLHGTGFYSGTNVRLVNPGIDTITSMSNSTVIIKGQRIQTTFNLMDKSIGEYDVEVTISGGIVLTLIDGFEVTEGTPVQLWSSIQGFDVIRPNQWQNYTVIVGNNGNVDATGVPFWISTPQNVEVDFDFPVTNPYGNAFDYDTIPNTFLTDTVWMMPSQSKMNSFVISKIPPNQSRTFSYKIKTPPTSNFEIQSWVNKPLYDVLQVLDKSPLECYKVLFEKSLLEKVELPVECGYSALDNIITIWKDSPYGDIFLGPGTSDPDYGSIEYILNFTKSLASMAVTCIDVAIGGAVGDLEKVVYLYHGTNSIIDIFQDCSGTVSALNQVIRKNLTVVNSYDPNDKIGPSGGGSENFYNNLTPYNYVIHFENLDTATAKAQAVLVLDTLDAAVFDYSTFQLGDLHIRDTVLNIPIGRQHYERLYNMVASQNVVVKITANFNDTTGVASWLFESLDPKTLTPVANPFNGFLPPNQNAPEGEGAVHYSVKLKSNLPNNTLIKNKAYIYFDNNPPLVTQEWQNTLDNIKPHSQVNQITAIQNNTLFNVDWNGIDTSSGIRDYDIYVSTNDGAYRPWLLNANFTNATFNGEVDSTYCFYSVATDWAGNVEAAPLLPDICTLISVTDTDCDGVPDGSDLCPGGDDSGPCNATSFPGFGNIPSGWICGNNNNKVEICHNGNTLCVSPNTVQAHLKHGDFLGPCSSCGGQNRIASINNDTFDPAEQFEMVISPNPTGDRINIHLIGEIKGEMLLTIYDHLGQVVLQAPLEDGQTNTSLDLAVLQPGIYLIVSSSGNDRLMKRFVVAR